MIDQRVAEAYQQMLEAGERVTLAALRRRAGVSAQTASEGLRELRSSSPRIDILPGEIVELATQFAHTAYQAGRDSISDQKIAFEAREGALSPAVKDLLPLSDLVPGLREVSFTFDGGESVELEPDDIPVVDLEGRLIRILERIRDRHSD